MRETFVEWKKKMRNVDFVKNSIERNIVWKVA